MLFKQALQSSRQPYIYMIGEVTCQDLFLVFFEWCERKAKCHSAARWPQPKRAAPCSPTLQSLNTETTEDLGDLWAKFFAVTEDTKALPGGLSRV